MTRSKTGPKGQVSSDRSEKTCPEESAHPTATTQLACVAAPEDEGARANVVLGRRIAGLSRRVARELALAGRLTVDGRRAPPSHRVRAGERLELAAPSAPAVAAPGPELLVATDAFVYVVKPAGLHTHRLRPDDPPALADRVAVRFPECAGAGLDAREGGAVHRLDRGTSGVVAFARTRAAFVAARDAFAAARVGKHYMAVTTCPFNHVWPPSPDAWIAPVGPAAVEVRAPLGPGFGRDRMAVRRTGQPALTRVEPQGPPGPRRLWSLELSTGRRHQARVHLAWLGLPILGDEPLRGRVRRPPVPARAAPRPLGRDRRRDPCHRPPAARVRRGSRLSATNTEAEPQHLDRSRMLRGAPTFLRSLYLLPASSARDAVAPLAASSACLCSCCTRTTTRLPPLYFLAASSLCLPSPYALALPTLLLLLRAIRLRRCASLYSLADQAPRLRSSCRAIHLLTCNPPTRLRSLDSLAESSHPPTPLRPLYSLAASSRAFLCSPAARAIYDSLAVHLRACAHSTPLLPILLLHEPST
ncbi:pseudouridine synthase [Nannocystis pusilla]|uniref:RluA family pseudouridine synthase n=1 Tax=Nannocystis pusilla TaxID=889268 RepID=UPI003DA36A31